MPNQKKAARITNLEHLTLVTETNREFSIVLGRICYVYSKRSNEYILENIFYIRPQLKKGWMQHGDIKVFISNDESFDDYVSTFREVLNLFIKEGRLYIDPTEELVKYKVTQ